MTPVGFDPMQFALVELESTPLDHSGKVSAAWKVKILGQTSRTVFPFGIIPLGSFLWDHSFGGSFLWGIIPLQHHSFAESFLWGIIPLGDHSFGGSFLWGIIPLRK